METEDGSDTRVRGAISHRRAQQIKRKAVIENRRCCKRRGQFNGFNRDPCSYERLQVVLEGFFSRLFYGVKGVCRCRHEKQTVPNNSKVDQSRGEFELHAMQTFWQMVLKTARSQETADEETTSCHLMQSLSSWREDGTRFALLVFRLQAVENRCILPEEAVATVRKPARMMNWNER